jgi:hypothetical protein
MTASASKTASDATSAPKQDYFNIITTGYGWLQRIRPVPVRGSKPYLACTIAALSGPQGDHSVRYIDCRVSGRDAINLVRNHKADIDANKPVIVEFSIGDLWAQVFQRPKGDPKGDLGISLKGRLLKAATKHPDVLKAIPYHHLLTRAFGRLSRVHQSRSTPSVLTCSLGAFNGPVEAFEFRNFDLTVCDDDAERLVLEHAPATLAKRKVQIAVLMEDLEPAFYIPTKGENAGIPVSFIRSNLINISTLKVDGEVMFKATSTDDPAREVAPAADSASAPQASSEQQPPKGKAKPKQQPTQAGQQPVTSGRSKAQAKPTPAPQQDSELHEFTEMDDIPF